MENLCGVWKTRRKGSDMKIAIEVENRRQGQAIKTALADREVRAFVLIMGELIPLPSDRARARVLRYVEDHLHEQNELRQAAPPADLALPFDKAASGER